MDILHRAETRRTSLYQMMVELRSRVERDTERLESLKERSRMVTLYHGTSSSRVESIFESGLIPPKCRSANPGRCKCQYDEYQHGNFDYRRGKLVKNFGFVYFTEKATDAFTWANRNGAFRDDVILAVKIRKADVEPDPIIDGAWRTPGPIPPKKIRIIYKGEEE